MQSAGGGQKIRYMREYLASREWKETDLILFCDGFDTNVCGTPEEFVNKWRLFECDVVFGAESFNWPGQCKRQPQLDTRFTFLNSGGYIGRAVTLKAMFESSELTDSADDQLFCQECYIVAPERGWNVKLDATKTIFCCLSDFRHNMPGAVKNIGTREQEVYFVQETQSYPLLIHGNGDNVIKRHWIQLVGE